MQLPFVANLTGLVLSQSLSSIVAIYITIPLLLIPQILLCGLVVKFDDLTPGSKTGNVPVIGEVIPSRWAFEALAVSSYMYNPYMKNFLRRKRKIQGAILQAWIPGRTAEPDGNSTG